MDLRAELITKAEAWCAATGKSKVTLGALVMKDGKFFGRLEAGKGCTIDTYERFMKFFAENLPSEAA